MEKNSKRTKFELQECLLSIILFTISTPFGHLFSIFFVFFFLQKTMQEKKQRKKERKNGCEFVSPVCSQFQSDVRKGYCGCKWTFMKKYFTHALKNLDRIQKMGKKKETSRKKHTTSSQSFFLSKLFLFCFVLFLFL